MKYLVTMCGAVLLFVGVLCCADGRQANAGTPIKAPVDPYLTTAHRSANETRSFDAVPSRTGVPSATQVGMAPVQNTPCVGGNFTSWTTVTPLNAARGGIDIVYFPATNKFYGLTGRTSSGQVLPIEEYDPVANTWTNRSPLNPGVTSTGAATVGQYIYVPGGHDGTSARTDMQRYDPVADSITLMAPMPAASYAHAVTAQGNKIYVLGGYASGPSSTNYIYDIASNTWSTGAIMPARVYSPAAASDGTYIYLIGGIDQFVNDLSTVFRYDPATNMWGAAPSMNAPRGELGGFFDGTRIWAVGGGHFAPLASTEYYVPGSGGWVYGPSMGYGLIFPGVGFGSDMALRAGGVRSGGTTTSGAEKLPYTPGNCPSPTPNLATNTPTATRTKTVVTTPTACTLNPNYVIASALATIVPGTVDIGNHCDECVTSIALPFPYQLYDETFTSANISSNGVVEFNGAFTDYINTCMPVAVPRFRYSILAYWDDQRTFTWENKGIYTSISGTAPNRILNIEFRTCTFNPFETCSPDFQHYYEVRLYEGQTRFDIIYGWMGSHGVSATVGVQRDADIYTQYSCNSNGSVTTGMMLVFTMQSCGTSTPTGTPATATSTYTRTPAAPSATRTTTPTGTIPTATPTQCPPGGIPSTWTTTANAPVDAYGPAAASDGIYAYSAGGYSLASGRTLDHFSRYDPAANSWATLAPMPHPAVMAGGAYAPEVNKVFVFGGQNYDLFVTYDVTRIYHVATGVWSLGANMPGPRSHVMVNYHNGKIYLIGGFAGPYVSDAQAQVWEYDPVANSWNTVRAPLPNALGGAGTGVIGGKIYIAGGRDRANTVLGTLYQYDVVSDNWATKAPLPGANSMMGSAALGGKLWIFGGTYPSLHQEGGATVVRMQPRPNEADITTSLVLYNPATDSWAGAPFMNLARSHLGGAAVGSAVVAWGGYTGSNTTNGTEVNYTTGNLCTTPTTTPFVSPTPTICPANYAVVAAVGTIVPGITDIGNHCADCETTINLPFPVTLYNQTFTTARASNDGYLKFGAIPANYSPDCLPADALTYTIFPFWADQITYDPGTGIFTSLTGIAPDRVFNIEWRSCVRTCCSSCMQGAETSYEIQLLEGQNSFNVIYGEMGPDTAPEGVIGVQKTFNSEFMEVSCNTGATSGKKYTFTLTPCNTSTTPTPTPTPALPTGTSTPIIATATASSTVFVTTTAVPPIPTSTHTLTVTATIVPTAPPNTVTATPTAQSASPTASPHITIVPTSTLTPCTISFSDVPSDSTFYTWITCLACRNIISGYSDGTFRPGNDITRGQIAKIVSNAAGFDEDPGAQIYEDVPNGSPFYAWVNRLSDRGYMGGYICGLVPEEPCNPPDNRPYFRPSASATRGQLAKIVSSAAGLGGDPTGLYYTDLPEDNPFYVWTMRLTQLGVMSGYACGGEGEPCDDQNRPYFRPFANVTRGQTSKIVANTFYPNCQIPAR